MPFLPLYHDVLWFLIWGITYLTCYMPLLRLCLVTIIESVEFHNVGSIIEIVGFHNVGMRIR
uniref:Uncharacterized protein n=1 Tax=Rhizophora mucronata TaxID=61149 RepID=A0A2P2NKA2_RHIMU